MVRTRRKRYSGGPERQDPGRNRPEDSPATDLGDSHGLRRDLHADNQRLTEIGEGPRCGPSTENTSGSEHEVNIEVGSRANLTESSSLLPSSTQRVAAGGFNARPANTRIRWSKEMNELVVKTFLLINGCKDDPLPGWRYKLYQQFQKDHPNLDLTEQNLADRLRFIYARKALTITEINRLRRQVANLSGNSESQEVQVDLESSVDVNEVAEEESTAEQQFLANYTLFENSDLKSRPGLPRLIVKRNTEAIIAHVNRALARKIENESSLDAIHVAIYAAAVTVTEINGQRLLIEGKTSRRKTPDTPGWKTRLVKQIDELRARADIVGEYIKGVRTRKVVEKLQTMLERTGLEWTDPQFLTKLKIYKDDLRQAYKVKGARLRRYNTATKRKMQNFRFSRSEKLFYRELEGRCREPEQDEIRNTAEFLDYWKNIWEVSESYSQTADWLPRVEEEQESVPVMDEPKITVRDVQEAIKKTRNWKTPGPDKIHNFWLKTFTSLPTSLARCFTNILENPETFPAYLACGSTHLIHKKGNKSDPKNYRPITCLSVVYKLLTSLLHRKIYEHCIANNIIAAEQKGCIEGSLGCKEQLTIDAVIMGQARRRHRNLNTCYIDYKKAFDSVPHDWLVKVLQVYKIHPKVIGLLTALMKSWKTALTLCGGEIDIVNISRGIFQGDALSPLWFVLALNPLSSILNQTSYGYRLNLRDTMRLTHLLFMDDIKLYSENRDHMNSLIAVVKEFSSDIRMQFGFDKCATVSLRKGKPSVEYVHENISPLDEQETYRYLGFAQHSSLNHTTLKQEFRDKYRQRLTKLLNTLLNSRNLTTAINTWAIPTLTYSFGILKYTDSDLQELDRLTRRLLTKFRAHHPGAAVERLYLPRGSGGRGLINIQDLCRKQESQMREYFVTSENLLLRRISAADQNYTPLNLSDRGFNISFKTKEQTQQNWKEKVLHGKFPHSISQPNIDKQRSLNWLEKGFLYPETEGFMIGIQDGVIRTRNYEKHVFGKGIEDRCRKCQAVGETIEHVIAGCPALAQHSYLGRHNQAAKIIHQQLSIKYGLIKDPPPYYRYTPEPVLESREHLMYWDRPIKTDKTTDFNRPDLVLIEKHKKRAVIIDVACPLTSNIQRTETEKVTKYENLAIELKRQWKLTEVRTIPVVMSATGVMSSNLSRGMEQLELPTTIINDIQKAVLLQTCHIVRKFFTSMG